MEKRNTIQKELIFKAVRTLANHPSAEEVYDFIHADYPTIGKGTVYRNLNLLAENGEIKKVEVNNGADRFDHSCHDHYHLMCLNCGRVFDVDMNVVPNILKKIKNSHGMKFVGYDLLFKGICYSCNSES